MRRAEVAPQSPVEIVPSRLALTQAERFGFEQGVLIDGVRVSRDGRAIAGVVARSPLAGGRPAPAWAGGGFWFFGGKALYRAGQFLGPLEPKVSLSESVHALAFGPNFLLVNLGAGGVLFLDPKTLQRKPPPVPAMYDVATAPDGRGLALAHPGLIWTRATKIDAAWQNVTTQSSGVPTRISVVAGTLWLETESDAYQVQPDGSLARFASRPTKPTDRDPRWPDANNTPLDLAVRHGVSLSDTLALVVVKGQVAKIRLPGGEIEDISSPVLPTDAACNLLPQGDDVLAACRGRNGFFAASGLLTEPQVERAFGASGYFVTGGSGTLAFAGGCRENSASEVRVCVRTNRDKWNEVRAASKDLRSAEGTDEDASSPEPTTLLTPDNLARIALGPHGHVIALVSGKNPGLYDLVRGRFTPFANDGHRKIPALFRQTPPRLISDSIQVDARGNLVGYYGNQAFTLSADGSFTPSVHSFVSLQGAAARILAVDREGQLWQSLDYGRNFSNAAPWPSRRGLRARACSHAGCDLGQMYRLGWRSQRQQPPLLAEAAEPPEIPLPALPRLSCTPRAAPAVKLSQVRFDPRTDEELDVLDLGAKRVALRGGSLEGVRAELEPDPFEMTRAYWLRSDRLLEAEGAELQAHLRRPVAFRFSPPFATDTKVRSSQVHWFGARSAPGSQHSVDLMSLAGTDDFSAHFVVGPRGSATELALTVEDASTVIMLREGRPAEMLTAPTSDDGELLSLARAKDGRLVALYAGEACDPRVQSLSASGRQLFRLPEQSTESCADGQVLGVQGNEFRVVQFSLTTPATRYSPAYALSADSASPLAAWETLTPANDAACKGHSGYRVVIALDARFLDVQLEQSDLSDVDDWLVVSGTWGPERFCVEAVEAAAPMIETDDEEVSTRIVARFGDNPGAARVALEPGAEALQELTCTLTSKR